MSKFLVRVLFLNEYEFNYVIDAKDLDQASRNALAKANKELAEKGIDTTEPRPQNIATRDERIQNLFAGITPWQTWARPFADDKYPDGLTIN